MPISGIKSYAPTMQQFINHWTEVNAQLGTPPLTLSDGTTKADFSELRDMIIAAMDAVAVAQILVSEKRGTLHDNKLALKGKLEMFRSAVLGKMPASVYAMGLPILPSLNAIETRFVRPFVEAADIWNRINTAPPLVLPDDTQILDFNTMLTNLRADFVNLINAEGAATTALKQRDSNLPLAKTWMKQYRFAVLSRLEPSDPLVASIPRYSPVAGATPKGVTNILFSYNTTTSVAKITFTPSTSKNLTQYDLRYSPDNKYNPADEETIATLPITGPFEFNFLFNFVDIGDTGLFKIYVTNATGNYRSSKVLKIRRAAAPALEMSSAPDLTLRRAA